MWGPPRGGVQRQRDYFCAGRRQSRPHPSPLLCQCAHAGLVCAQQPKHIPHITGHIVTAAGVRLWGGHTSKHTHTHASPVREGDIHTHTHTHTP